MSEPSPEGGMKIVKDAEIKKKLEYYMKLPYTMTVKRHDDQGFYYLAGFVELPDLFMVGPTEEDAVKELLVEKPGYFEECIKRGFKIPVPLHTEKYSGKINFRMPRRLHEKVAAIAKSEGVSLNQYLLTAVAQAAGADEKKVLGKIRK
jgi:predicted RNase H-like HicB family nuclease